MLIILFVGNIICLKIFSDSVGSRTYRDQNNKYFEFINLNKKKIKGQVCKKPEINSVI